MNPTVLKCRYLRRDLRSLVMVVVVAFVVLLFTEFESRRIFATTAIACGLINPTIRVVLLHYGVIRPTGRQSSKKIQFAEGLLILGHMFRVMFASLAPVAIASVAIELTTSGNHGVASVIACVLSGVVLWAMAIAVTCYWVKCAKRDLDRLYTGSPSNM